MINLFDENYIDLVKLTEKEVTSLLDITSRTYYNKISGKTDFTFCELKKLREHYKIPYGVLFKIIDDERKKRDVKN